MSAPSAHPFLVLNNPRIEPIGREGAFCRPYIPPRPAFDGIGDSEVKVTLLYVLFNNELDDLSLYSLILCDFALETLFLFQEFLPLDILLLVLEG